LRDDHPTACAIHDAGSGSPEELQNVIPIGGSRAGRTFPINQWVRLKDLDLVRAASMWRVTGANLVLPDDREVRLSP
jgi:hypothetical protein